MYTTEWLHSPGVGSINKEIAPILNCARCECWDAGGVFFATATQCDQHGIHHTLYHHKGHPKQGQHKYDWHEAVPGVAYGYLLPDDTTREVALSRYAATIKDAQDRRAAEAAAKQSEPVPEKTENELA
jgi:hypothetical protein